MGWKTALKVEAANTVLWSLHLACYSEIFNSIPQWSKINHSTPAGGKPSDIMPCLFFKYS